jgi:hypothetical protein
MGFIFVTSSQKIVIHSGNIAFVFFRHEKKIVKHLVCKINCTYEKIHELFEQFTMNDKICIDPTHTKKLFGSK